MKIIKLLFTIFLGGTGIPRMLRGYIGTGFLSLFTYGGFGVIWIFDIYLSIFYNSKKFEDIKNSIKKNIDDCNELNAHIENLKNSYDLIDNKIDYGSADLVDTSSYNMRRKSWKELNSDEKHVYHCSSTVCKNAKTQPFKYLCKYFNIAINEENLSTFEQIFNNFSAVEQGKNLLISEQQRIIDMVEIPAIIRLFDKKGLYKELNFTSVDLSEIYFPTYTFSYVSAGGNSSDKCIIKMDLDNLEKFISYLDSQIKRKKSAEGQRALMTSKLREKIKERDDYTCKYCGASVHKEPNLLLEIDHIIPISKGGQSTEDNLQTLCWRCNRHKGNKIVNGYNCNNQ